LDWIAAHRTNVIKFAVTNHLDPSAVYSWLAGRTPSLKHAVTIERATGVPCAAWITNTEASA
jgi:hypothetical protein